MALSLIGAGSNLGDRAATLRAASDALAGSKDIRLLAQSQWRETRPVGGPSGQADYLNAAFLIETMLQPHPLLERLLQIEAHFGRQRHERWAARTLDLDLLLYDNQIIHLPDLVVPHPRLVVRRFVLEPAAEIAPDLIEPTTGWTIRQLADHLRTAAKHVAVLGSPSDFARQIAFRVAQSLSAQLLTDDMVCESQSSAVSSGLTLAAQIKFADRRVALLQSAGRVSGGRGWIVSDFGFGESLALAELTLAPSDYERFCAHWRRLDALIAPPRFVAAIDPSAEPINQTGKTPAAKTAREQYQLALTNWTHQPGHGPILHLPKTDRDALAAEIVAAAQATE
jgi:2-amino-4-hydroxy-6-hydroxymethyldihydropteridine diphosphokinase